MVQRENWIKLNLEQQLGNIGSEFHRWVKTDSEKSFEEVLALLDLTIGDPRWRTQLKELTRLREVICDAATGSKMYLADPSALEQYFLSFAILARK